MRTASSGDYPKKSAGLRQDMRDGFAAVRLEAAAQRTELLKWSFLFWVGQVAAIAGMLDVLLR